MKNHNNSHQTMMHHEANSHDYHDHNHYDHHKMMVDDFLKVFSFIDYYRADIDFISFDSKFVRFQSFVFWR